MSDSAPSISVVISSYNHAPYLRECIASVLNQTWRPAEVIVVDDGSTDSSREIIEGFQDAVRPIFQENQGTYAALNAGVALSCGEWIAFQNSDDVWEPNKLEKQVRLAAAHPHVGLVHTSFVCIDAQGETFPRPPTVTDYQGPPESEMLPLMLHTMPIVISSVMLPRPVWEKYGPFDPRYHGAGDLDLCLRISQEFRFGFVNEPLVRLRKHPDNSGTNPNRLPPVWVQRDWQLLCTGTLPTAARCLYERSRKGEIPRDEAALALASLGVIHTRSGERRLARRALNLSIRLLPTRAKTWIRYLAACRI